MAMTRILVLCLVIVSHMGEAKELFPSVVSACERIFEYFPNCLEFLVGGSKLCYALKKIIVLVMVKGMTPALVPSKIQNLPLMCHTTLSFPVSDSIDCSKVR
ncbi:non-specific lipid-transfer protein 13-like [Glycine soja]|uniref:non-specific lipid-transfer protein 13-like n=1 Tax=Glycine soja TaxID=3848 RepID=UPI00054A63BD|nr:non-specific lipid-transfer protein 13-like [Glycine soja]KHN36636.1 Non-specific lipid-transfer protein 13 [Glycine soja]